MSIKTVSKTPLFETIKTVSQTFIYKTNIKRLVIFLPIFYQLNLNCVKSLLINKIPKLNLFVDF